MQDEKSTESKIAPVYVPYATFITSLDALRQHGIPASGVIDKSIWDTQSGTIRAQLILGYKFLGLIDGNRNVMAALPELVSAEGEKRKALLKDIVEDKYRSIISIGLTTISPAQFEEAFRKFDIDGSTIKRASRFFIKACSELGVPISKRFLDRARTSGTRKKRAPNGTKVKEDTASSDQSAPQRSNDALGSSAMKTIQLPRVGGVLSITGTFNAFMLMGDERKLVYDIIDLMTTYEAKSAPQA